MNNARLRAIEESQTGTAKKVLAAVPIEDRWTLRQVASEISRATGSFPDLRTVQGCLAHLTEVGLIRELRGGLFQRIPMKSEDHQEENVVTKPEATPFRTVNAAPPVSTDPLDRMAAVASKLRALAQQAATLATECEEAAIAMEEKSAKASTDSAKLRQLQELLKGG